MTLIDTSFYRRQRYFLPLPFATYFTAVPEHKNALSAGKNIGFYHVLNEKLSCGNVAQQHMDFGHEQKLPRLVIFNEYK